MKEKPFLASIDADFLLYIVAHTERGNPLSDAKMALSKRLSEIVEKLDCTDCRVYVGSTSVTNFRYATAVTYPYKGNRAASVKPEHYEALHRFIVKLGAIEAHGEEADDRVARDSVSGDYILVHVDKDLNQLEGWHYNPVTGAEYYIERLEGLYNFYIQMLMGDSTDNIKGIPGMGKVGAAKVLVGAHSENEMCTRVLEQYKAHQLPYEYLLETANLLYLRREKDVEWSPPYPV